MKKDALTKLLSLVLACTLLSLTPVRADTLVTLDPVFASAPVTLGVLTEVTQHLAAHPIVRARFIQTKHISALTRPLISRGSFLYARDVGIEWHTEKPFAEDFIITARGITKHEQGQPALQIAGDSHPAIRGFTNVFFALFRADLAALQKSFRVYFTPQDQKWTIGLETSDSNISHFLRAIVLKGDQTVNQVVLYEANGDTTQIDFSDIGLTPSTLTDSERALFQ